MCLFSTFTPSYNHIKCDHYHPFLHLKDGLKVDRMISCLPTSNRSLTVSLVKPCIPITRSYRYRRRLQTFSLSSESLFPDEDYQQDHCLYIFSNTGNVMYIPGYKTKRDLRKSAEKIIKRHRLPTVDEQSICVGGTFSVAASNGIDIKRKIHFQGFCQSTEILGECVEDVVKDRGWEIIHQQHSMLQDGFHEELKMIVAVPFLFGVPPELETLKSAIELGGGLLHRVYGQWYIY